MPSKRVIWDELHNLTKAERDVIARYESNPAGPAFVSAADILRKRGYLDECIVILEEGIKKYPQYHSARAALGKDYYLKGMMTEARAAFAIVTSRTPDNLMAQRYRLRLDVLCDDVAAVHQTLAVLKQIARDDDLTREVRACMAIDDWERARVVIVAELVRLAVPGEWKLPEPKPVPPPPAPPQVGASARPGTSEPEPAHWDPQSPSIPTQEIKPEGGTWTVPLPPDEKVFDEEPEETEQPPRPAPAFVSEDALPRAPGAGAGLGNVRGDADRYQLLRGYRMMPAGGLYAGESAGDARHAGLESATLADIYANQGLYSKAIEIYERLCKEAPNDGRLRLRLDELRVKLQAGGGDLVTRASPARGGAHADDPPFHTPGARAERPSGAAAKERKIALLETLLRKLETHESEAPWSAGRQHAR